MQPVAQPVKQEQLLSVWRHASTVELQYALQAVMQAVPKEILASQLVLLLPAQHVQLVFH